MRDCRKIDGILLLDKPTGMTSNRALQEVKRQFRACKAGHTGSLDPLATGVLPICLGEATKLSDYLLNADKAYRTSVRLGQATTTYDSEGDITAERTVSVDEGDIRRALRAFVGEILQVPPMYSAIKQGGQPLYKQARAGVTVERAPRRVCIYDARLVAFDGQHAELAVECSKGTYIRSLAHDLGQALGCGAHVAQLRRERVGEFALDRAVALATLKTTEPDRLASLLMPGDGALGAMPSVTLLPGAALNLSRGQTVFAAKGYPAGPVRVYTEQGEFLGIGEITPEGWLSPRRLRATTVTGEQKSVEDGGLRG